MAIWLKRAGQFELVAGGQARFRGHRADEFNEALSRDRILDAVAAVEAVKK